MRSSMAGVRPAWGFPEADSPEVKPVFAPLGASGLRQGRNRLSQDPWQGTSRAADGGHHPLLPDGAGRRLGLPGRGHS